jgi:cyclase
MLRFRLIPCLLLKGGGLVKTRGFRDPKYVGDPINAVRIFNEKEVDEIIIADVDASIRSLQPDQALIRKLAAECRMPMCYAGGINNPDVVERIVNLGVEKVAIGSAAVTNPRLVEESARRVGSQSVIGVIDVKRSQLEGGYEVFTHSGTAGTKRRPADVAKDLETAGAGELVVNSIDRDGEMSGYDLELIELVWESVSLQITALGGAGSMNDVVELVRRFGILGAAAGSMFVFKGKYRAVLISYPARAERDALWAREQPLERVHGVGIGAR